MRPQLHEFLSQHFTIRVNEKGEEVEKPKGFNHFDNGYRNAVDLNEKGLIWLKQCEAYNNAKEVIKCPKSAREFWELIRSDKNLFSDQTIELQDYWFEFEKMPLHLGLFVPVKDGKVLEEPERWNHWISEFKKGRIHLEDNRKHIDYKTALDQVIFEGYEIEDTKPSDGQIFGNYSQKLTVNGRVVATRDFDGWIFRDNLKTISDLIPFGLNLKV